MRRMTAAVEIAVRPRRFGVLLAGITFVVATLAMACTAAPEADPDGPIHAQMHVHDGSNDDELFNDATARVVGVTLADISFTPSTLRAERDSLVEIDLTNNGKLDHDFTIEKIDVDQATRRDGEVPVGHQHMDQYAVHVALGPAQTARLRLHLHEPGTYSFFCTVPGHREAGMRGSLVIE